MGKEPASHVGRTGVAYWVNVKEEVAAEAEATGQSSLAGAVAGEACRLALEVAYREGKEWRREGVVGIAVVEVAAAVGGVIVEGEEFVVVSGNLVEEKILVERAKGCVVL